MLQDRETELGLVTAGTPAEASGYTQPPAEVLTDLLLNLPLYSKHSK